MRTISYKLDDLKKAVIRIGYVGENQHTQVRIDCKDLFKEYPDAAVSMAIVSPAGQSYPKVVTVDGSTVVWDVTDSDLAAEGDGEIQLTFTEGGVVAKTAVARFNVYRSIAADGPAPDPVDDWLQEASEALEDIEAAEVNQPIIGQDGYWYTWDQEAGEYVKTSTKAQGEDGQPGHTPEKGVDYWTASDKAEMESDVAGAIIDDTSTALDKTWSASKSNTLLSDLQALEGDVSDAKNMGKSAVSLLGHGTVSNKSIQGSSNNVTIITMDLIANEAYCMNLKIKSAVSKAVYMGMTQSDGTVIGYVNAITVGNTYVYKLLIPASDFKNARFIVKCDVDFEIEYANIFAEERIDNQIGRLITGDNISLLNITATNKKILSATGEVTATSDTTYYVTDDIQISEGHWYKVTGSAGYGGAYYAILDADKNVMITHRSPGGSGTVCVNRMVYMPANSKYIRIAYVTTLSGGHIALCNSVKAKTTKAPDWWYKFLTISYSGIGTATINTLESYISAAHFGFNVCKGDVRPTSDHKLVMCHDGGFTFDSNGRITTYNAGNRTLIDSMSLETALTKEYAGFATATENNHYQKVTDIDSYLKVCKQHGMIAFITIREDYINYVCSELIAALKRNDMLDRAIINSYTAQALSYIRMLDDNLPLSFVQADNYTLGSARIGAVAGYGKAAITLVSTPANMRTYLTGLESAIAEANNKGVRIMYAQPTTYEDVLWLINHGIMGAQIGRPCVPYQFRQIRFKISIASGTASLSEWFDMTTMEVDISQSGNVISVSDFKDAGSEHDFADLIMEYWMNRFPYRITAASENGNAVTATWQNNALELIVSDISVNDTIDVIVEV